jgi:hypothetical protein
LTCLFAYSTVDEAREYRAACRDPGTEEIWRVSCDQPEATHVADNRWLHSPFNALRFVDAARRYWSGDPLTFESSLEPDHEVLITTAILVKVVEPVEHHPGRPAGRDRIGEVP